MRTRLNLNSILRLPVHILPSLRSTLLESFANSNFLSLWSSPSVLVLVWRVLMYSYVYSTCKLFVDVEVDVCVLCLSLTCVRFAVWAVFKSIVE